MSCGKSCGKTCTECVSFPKSCTKCKTCEPVKQVSRNNVGCVQYGCSSCGSSSKSGSCCEKSCDKPAPSCEKRDETFGKNMGKNIIDRKRPEVFGGSFKKLYVCDDIHVAHPKLHHSYTVAPVDPTPAETTAYEDGFTKLLLPSEVDDGPIGASVAFFTTSSRGVVDFDDETRSVATACKAGLYHIDLNVHGTFTRFGAEPSLGDDEDLAIVASLVKNKGETTATVLRTQIINTVIPPGNPAPPDGTVSDLVYNIHLSRKTRLAKGETLSLTLAYGKAEAGGRTYTFNGIPGQANSQFQAHRVY